MKNLKHARRNENHEVFTSQIERIASNGAGILTRNGQKFFVDATAPLDRVTVRVQELHKGWGTAEVLRIEEQSPFRTPCVCPLAGRCGGCSLQHLAYEKQVEEKAAILRESFVRIGGFKEPPAVRIRPSKAFGYRNRVQFHRFKASLPGFKVKRSDEIIQVAACPVADQGINNALAEKRITPPVEKDRWTVYSYKDTFLMEGKNGRGSVVLLDKKLLLDAGVFFQSNASALETLIKDVVSIAKETGSGASAPPLAPLAADVYCGVGTFSVFLQDAGCFESIDLVEENKTALSLARGNISAVAAAGADQGVRGNCYAVSADVWAKGNKNRYGFIIADPPREGLSQGMRAWLCAQGSPVFAYVSCNPATLARDSEALVKSGYALSSLAFYDFYPHTPHIESLAVFRRSRL
ncbi:MAG: methyltransferase [Treponema sp.]|jgi:23S rRNA (uracil1939-C5)-methyltransferase|nr:methyltransferase [Treponema sp.]